MPYGRLCVIQIFADLLHSDCGNITTPWPSGWESTSFSECNLPCLGNATELCGGTLDEGRFFAYSNLPEVAAAPPAWLEQGCWMYVFTFALVQIDIDPRVL